MLTQVLTLLAEHRGGLNLQEMSRRLDVQPGALEGMLELLVSKRRLVKLDPRDQPCGQCPLHADCNLVTGSQPRYMLVRRCGLGDQALRPRGLLPPGL